MRYGKHADIVFKEMCRRVKAPFKTIDSNKDPEWYKKYKWTLEQEKDFLDWLVNYWYNNAEARNEMTRCKKNKKCLEEAKSWFSLQYSWSYK
jgi:hypothetical protein